MQGNTLRWPPKRPLGRFWILLLGAGLGTGGTLFAGSGPQGCGDVAGEAEQGVCAWLCRGDGASDAGSRTDASDAADATDASDATDAHTDVAVGPCPVLGARACTDCRGLVGNEDPPGAWRVGVDVSSNQGVIDWSSVQGAGARFAIVRATDGLDFTDKCLAYNWQALNQTSLRRGAYHVFEVADPGVAQAEWYLQHVSLAAADFPALLDVEHAELVDADLESARTEVIAWVEHVEADTGRQPIIYTSTRVLALFDQVDPFDGTPVWLAHYSDSLDADLPVGSPAWLLWQFSSDGQVAGINRRVDLDRYPTDGGPIAPAVPATTETARATQAGDTTAGEGTGTSEGTGVP